MRMVIQRHHFAVLKMEVSLLSFFEGNRKADTKFESDHFERLT
jgi:hypothetical protein